MQRITECVTYMSQIIIHLNIYTINLEKKIRHIFPCFEDYKQLTPLKTDKKSTKRHQQHRKTKLNKRRH